MKKIILLLLIAVTVQTVKAQLSNDPIYHQKSLQFNVGTQGAGAEFGYGILSPLALRLGINLIPVTANNVFQVPGFATTNRVNVQFSNVHLLADLTPFSGARGIRVVAGGAYFMQANGGMEVTAAQNFTYGAITVNPDQIGKLNMNVSWKGVAPYMGLALAKMFPRNTFNVNLDLGTYYMPAPSAQIIGTALLEGNSSQALQLEKNIKGYRWLPVVQLNFNFKL
jgi:hypothetical protein